MPNCPVSQHESKICASCGDEFGCGANLGGCWCTEVTISTVDAAHLKVTFNDCLCPKCLVNFARKGRDDQIAA